MRSSWLAGLTTVLVLASGGVARGSTTSVFYDGLNNLAASPNPFPNMTPNGAGSNIAVAPTAVLPVPVVFSHSA